MKLQCLVVDDEPIAQQILEKYIGQVNALSLVGKCGTGFEALNVLHTKKIDVLFLDIKMPLLSGLEMLKALHNPPKVILTTAFSEFGAESYEYGVTDYLLKPISFQRFMKAVNKILMPQLPETPSNEMRGKTSSELEFIFFKADKKIYKLYLKNILFIEGSGNYVKVHTENDRPLMVFDKLSDLMEKLPQNQFLRVHKSFIVNFLHIKQIEGNVIKLPNKEIFISDTYKQSFDAFIKLRK